VRATFVNYISVGGPKQFHEEAGHGKGQ